ncbi:FAD-dependent monooxygenase [Komagataeibacter oboediens]|uniref:FAD-dependent monooxygenase n=1 Tax=Komagataeibacter oboediens TaxID=65958 RepID=UPI0019073F93|nr:FAD-dependent monooxygenase [Komagataeibacter oboediens]GCE78972.1 monooxygenase FAD-binding [Komagataeibacter oboediens]
MPKPVLVVGAGPVGLTMAAELARHGVPVRLVDRLPARDGQSRALAIWARTLELLDIAGCADAFMAAGLRARTLDIHAGRTVLARIAFGAIASPFACLLMLAQPDTERLLEDHLRTLGGHIERGVELTDFVDTGTGVTCTLRHDSGEVETMDAAWLIGCDGAHSLVRRTLGLAFTGATLPTRFILADAHVTGLPTAPDALAMFWHPDGAAMFFPVPGGRYRIIADVGPASVHAPDLRAVQTIVNRRGPGGVTVSDPVWLSAFGVNERRVRDYRAGRVFVAGDAAHVHSPAGGQGMNTGMQDAFNLAWKLALVERGQAGPALLDSYGIERGAVARQVLSDSGRVTRIVLLRNPLARLLRALVVRGVSGLPVIRHMVAAHLSEIMVAYPGSPLNMGDAAGLRGPRPGQRFAPARGHAGAHGPCLTLAATDHDAARALVARHAGLLSPHIRPPPDPRGMWLLRPDGYVAATARADRPQVIDRALERIRAGAPPHRDSGPVAG